MKKQISILLVLCLVAALIMTVGATDVILHVKDFAELLTDTQWDSLNGNAINISEAHSCGVYAMTVDRWQDYGGYDVLDCAREIYDSYGMGYGPDRDGILLLLSMEERDYALFTLGSNAEAVFDDYTLRQLEEEFLDDLAENNWAGGIGDYIGACEAIVQGTFTALNPMESIPVQKDPGYAEPGLTEEGISLESLAVVIFLPCVIALVVCLILKAQMKSVRKQSADAYIGPDGLNLQIQEDRFLYNTVTRRRIDTSSSSGRSGGSHSSGGSSRGGGRSGKF